MNRAPKEDERDVLAYLHLNEKDWEKNPSY